MCSVAMVLAVVGIAAGDTKDSKKKLQIGIKKRIDADKCTIKSRKMDVLSMHYTVGILYACIYVHDIRMIYHMILCMIIFM